MTMLIERNVSIGVQGVGFITSAVSNTIIPTDASAVDVAEMGTEIGDSGVVCKDDGVCTFLPSSPLSALDGQNPRGTWALLIRNTGGDLTGQPFVGSISSLTLSAEYS